MRQYHSKSETNTNIFSPQPVSITNEATEITYGGGGRNADGVVAYILKPPSLPLTLAKERRTLPADEVNCVEARADAAIAGMIVPNRDILGQRLRDQDLG